MVKKSHLSSSHYPSSSHTIGDVKKICCIVYAALYCGKHYNLHCDHVLPFSWTSPKTSYLAIKEMWLYLFDCDAKLVKIDLMNNSYKIWFPGRLRRKKPICTLRIWRVGVDKGQCQQFSNNCVCEVSRVLAKANLFNMQCMKLFIYQFPHQIWQTWK